MGWAQMYLTHLDCFVVQCWVSVTYLSPNTIYQTRPRTYKYVKFFEGKVGYMPLSTPCNCIMAIIDWSDATMPFVVSLYLALWTAPASQCHCVAKYQVLNELTVFMLCPFRWLCCVNEFVCIFMYYSLYLCTNLLWVPGAHRYFALFI